MDEPQLSVVPFRLAMEGFDDAALDRLNHDFLEAVNRRRRVFLTGTMLDGRFTLRICVLSFRTHLDRMRMCLEDIRAAAGEVRERWRESGLPAATPAESGETSRP